MQLDLLSQLLYILGQDLTVQMFMLSTARWHVFTFWLFKRLYFHPCA